MKASTVIRTRRALGNWLAYALPDDHEEDTRTPDPPPERKEAQRPSCAPSDKADASKTTTIHVLP